MIAITIDGGTRLQRRLVRQATWFYVRRLIGARESIGISINILLVPGMRRKENTRADCMSIDPDDKECVPTEFEIRLDSTMNTVAILKALAHECVHLKQYFLEEMISRAGSEYVLFKGKLCRNSFRIEKYYDLPWEIEANGREHGLYARFCKSHGYEKARWNRDFDFL